MIKKTKPVMRVLLADLHHGARHHDVQCTPEELELADETFEFVGPVTASLDFEPIHNEVYMHGTANCTVKTDCVRCLCEANVRIEAALKVMYVKDKELLTDEAEFAGTEDGGRAYYDGDVVVADTQLREALMLELPDMPHCSEACRGLCITCGANLNTEPCACNTPITIAPDDDKEEVPPAPLPASESWKQALSQLKKNGN